MCVWITLPFLELGYMPILVNLAVLFLNNQLACFFFWVILYIIKDFKQNSQTRQLEDMPKIQMKKQFFKARGPWGYFFEKIKKIFLDMF